MRKRMLNKGGMEWDEIVRILILGIVLVLLVMVFITPNGRGLLWKAAKSFVPQSFLPNYKEDFQQIPLPEVPPSVDATYNKLVDIFKKGHQGPCIVEYGGKDMKEWSIIFTNLDEGTKIELLSDKKQLVKKDFVPKQNVCVVGGEIWSSSIFYTQSPDETREIAIVDSSGKVKSIGQWQSLSNAFGYNDDSLKIAAKNFYTNWIAEYDENLPTASRYKDVRKVPKRIISPDYTNPQTLTITGKNSMEVQYYDPPQPQKLGKEDGGLLYVPEGGKVCLIPTFKYAPLTDYSEKGIHADYVTDLKNKVGNCKS